MARYAALLLIPLALALAGCTTPAADPGTGGDGGNGTGGAGDGADGAADGASPAPVSLAVRTAGQWPVDPSFDPPTLTAAAGALVTLTFTNADAALPVGSMKHDWVLEGVDGAATAQLDAGQEETITFLAPAAGTYKYYCSVGDHRQRGMEGTLTVAG